MNPFDRVVLGVDFSDASRVAFEHAVVLSKALGVPLLLVHAWNPRGWLPDFAGDDAPDWLEDVRGGTMGELDAWARSAEKRGADADIVLERGSASEILIALSRKGTLLVLGRRGQASLAHVLLGSVSERVVSAARSPVLIVPRRAEVGRTPRRFLIGADLSANSAAAAVAARDVARAVSSAPTLVVAHAQNDERALWLEHGSEIGRERSPVDEERLRRWARSHVGRAITLETCLIKGRAEEGLVSVAQEKNCDWLVLGVQGRTALAALLIGSTTREILRLADRPVLVAPATDRPEPPAES